MNDVNVVLRDKQHKQVHEFEIDYNAIADHGIVIWNENYYVFNSSVSMKTSVPTFDETEYLRVL
jgi:hypothetical protein